MARRLLVSAAIALFGIAPGVVAAQQCTAQACTTDGDCEERGCSVMGPADPTKKKVSGYIISCTG